MFGHSLHGPDARGHGDCPGNTGFNPQAGLIIVRSELFGPSGSIILRLALDTGATSTMISVGPLAAVGYDPSLVSDRVQVITGSGVEFVPRIQISRLTALGRERTCFPILSHTLPPSAGRAHLDTVPERRSPTRQVLRTLRKRAGSEIGAPPLPPNRGQYQDAPAALRAKKKSLTKKP